MKASKPPLKEMSPPWPREPLYRRLNDCTAMLLLHGIITDAERARLHNRLMKRIEEENRESGRRRTLKSGRL